MAVPGTTKPPQPPWWAVPGHVCGTWLATGVTSLYLYSCWYALLCSSFRYSQHLPKIEASTIAIRCIYQICCSFTTPLTAFSWCCITSVTTTTRSMFQNLRGIYSESVSYLLEQFFLSTASIRCTRVRMMQSEQHTLVCTRFGRCMLHLSIAPEVAKKNCHMNNILCDVVMGCLSAVATGRKHMHCASHKWKLLHIPTILIKW